MLAQLQYQYKKKERRNAIFFFPLSLQFQASCRPGHDARTSATGCQLTDSPRYAA